MIANTSRADKEGTHWWSIIDIDSFGVLGLKIFIIKDDEKIIQKVLKGIEKILSKTSVGSRDKAM